MSKHHHNQPAQRTAFPGDGPKEVVFQVRRHQGQWQLRKLRIPSDVLDQCVVDEHGPDLFGMCLSRVEYEIQKLPEGGE